MLINTCIFAWWHESYLKRKIPLFTFWLSCILMGSWVDQLLQQKLFNFDNFSLNILWKVFEFLSWNHFHLVFSKDKLKFHCCSSFVGTLSLYSCIALVSWGIIQCRGKIIMNWLFWNKCKCWKVNLYYHEIFSEVSSLNSFRILVSYEERVSSISGFMVLESSMIGFNFKSDCNIAIKHGPMT